MTSTEPPSEDQARVKPERTTERVVARGWLDVLGQIGAQLADEHSPVAREHWHHRRLYAELVRVVTALGHAHPGGLDRLSGR